MSLWVGERGKDWHRSDRTLILVEFEDQVVAYDCRQVQHEAMKVFTDPQATFWCSAAEHNWAEGWNQKVHAVITEGKHKWAQGWYKTKELPSGPERLRSSGLNETNDEPMDEGERVVVPADWEVVPAERVVVPADSEVPADWHGEGGSARYWVVYP